MQELCCFPSFSVSLKLFQNKKVLGFFFLNGKSGLKKWLRTRALESDKIKNKKLSKSSVVKDYDPDVVAILGAGRDLCLKWTFRIRPGKRSMIGLLSTPCTAHSQLCSEPKRGFLAWAHLVYQGEPGVWRQTDLAVKFKCCVILGRLLNFSVPQFIPL